MKLCFLARHRHPYACRLLHTLISSLNILPFFHKICDVTLPWLLRVADSQSPPLPTFPQSLYELPWSCTGNSLVRFNHRLFQLSGKEIIAVGVKEGLKTITTTKSTTKNNNDINNNNNNNEKEANGGIHEFADSQFGLIYKEPRLW